MIVAGDWYRRAQLALEKGDEELAREALSRCYVTFHLINLLYVSDSYVCLKLISFIFFRRQIQLDTVENLNKQLSIQGAAVDKLYSTMGLLEQKIGEAKRQKEVNEYATTIIISVA